MATTRRAKLFKNGASQAVRLPAEFRFNNDEVFITRDEKTNDVVLSTRPGARTWKEFFEFARAVDVPMAWMKKRPMNRISKDRKRLFRATD